MKKTLEYLFKYDGGKRFFLTWLFLLPPCVLVGFFFPTTKYMDFLFGFRTTEYATFGDLWTGVFPVFPYAWIALAAAAVLFVLGVGYVSSILTRHIRVGKLTFPNFFRSINNNFFPALTVTAFFLLTVFAAHVLFVLNAYIWVHLASRLLGLVMTVLFFLLILIGMAYLMSSATLWLPYMSFTGTYVFRALGIAFYKSRNRQRQFFLPCLFAVVFALAAGLAGYYCPLWYVDAIIHTLVYSVSLTVMVTFTIISYCEVESVQREDLSRPFFGR